MYLIKLASDTYILVFQIFIIYLLISAILTLSKPSSVSLDPSTGPIPARSATGFWPIGSEIKFLCFCDVDDISESKPHNLLMVQHG